MVHEVDPEQGVSHPRPAAELHLARLPVQAHELLATERMYKLGSRDRDEYECYVVDGNGHKVLKKLLSEAICQLHGSWTA